MTDDLIALIKREKSQSLSCPPSNSRHNQFKISQLLRLIRGTGSPDIAGEIRKSRSQGAKNEGILITELRKNSSRRDYHATQQQNLQPIFPYWSLQSIQSEISRLSIKGREPNLVEEIKKQQGNRILYDVSSVQIEQPAYDSELVRQVRKDYIDRYTEPDDKLKVGEIDGNYQIVITERCVENPFVIDSELVKIIKKHTRKCTTDYDKARAIFDWFEENIQYGDRKRNGHKYRNSEEVLETKEGVCGEMAYLYVAMSRVVGLKSNYVSVRRDCHGKKVHHGCAIVDTESGSVLVDPAYHIFDVQHSDYDSISDEKAINQFKEWRR